MPVYNVQDYLAECLDSVLGQTLDSLEVIAVDDGSTDESPAILDDYARRDPRVRIIRRLNGGLGAARNTGLEHVRGKYLTFVDSDDTIPPDAYQVMCRSLEGSGSDLAAGGMVRIRRGSQAPLWWSPRLHERRRVGIRLEEFPMIIRDFYTPNKVYRTSFWRDRGFRFREGVLFEDQPLVTQLYCAAGTIDVLPEVTYRWRVRGDGTSISQNLFGPEEIAARAEAIALTRPVVEGTGSPGVVQAWKWSLLQFHFPYYLTHSDESSYDAIVAMMRSAVDEQDVLQNAECAASNKVLNYLALTRSEDLTREFMRASRSGPRSFPVRWEDDAGYMELPFFEDPEVDLPKELFRLTDWECTGRASLRGVRWTSTAVLEVSGRAFVEYIDPGLFPQRTELLAHHHESGVEVAFSAEVDDRPWPGSQGGHEWIGYENTSFVSRVDTEVLRKALADAGFTDGLGSWTLEAHCAIRGFSRRALFRDVPRPSVPPAAAYTSLPDDCVVRARWASGSEGLVLDTFRSDVVARSIQATEESVSIECRVTDDAPQPVAACLVGGPDRQDVPLTVRPGEPGTVHIDAPLPDLLSVQPRTRLSVVGADGSRHPVLVTDAAWSDAHDAGVLMGRNRNGAALFDGRQRRVVVTSLELREGGVEVSGRCIPKRVSEDVRLHLRSARLTSPDAAVQPGPDGRFTAWVPFGYREWGRTVEGLLPLGRYELDAGAEPVLPAMAAQNEALLEPPPMRVDLLFPDSRRAVVRVRSPLDAQERTRRGQRAMWDRWSMTEEPLLHQVLFRCLQGDVVTDTQLAVSLELHRTHPSIRQVWATQDHTVKIPAHASRVIVDSEDHFRARATSRWIVVNHDLPKEFVKRPGQVVVQTYHGHPFKLMGLSRWRASRWSEVDIQRALARAAQWDYLVAPSPLAEELYRENFPVETTMLTIGHPRNDPLLAPSAPRVRERTRDLLGLPEGVVAILYAPTWRDYSSQDPWKSKLVDFLDPGALAAELGGGFRLLLRGHPSHQRHTYRAGAVDGVVDVTDYPEINDLILASDVGLFDYSSIRFDYSVTRKPMLFFVPDEEVYLRNVGSLRDFSTSTPGPTSHTQSELVADLRRLDRVQEEYRASYDRFVETFNPLDDGHATSRLIEAVFGAPETAAGADAPESGS